MGSRWSTKFPSGGISFLLTLCFVVAMFHGRTMAAIATPSHPARRLMMPQSLDRLEVGGRGLPTLEHGTPQLFYVGKRRVPNGADPIHNRRAGKAGRPAGRA